MVAVTIGIPLGRGVAKDVGGTELGCVPKGATKNGNIPEVG